MQYQFRGGALAPVRERTRKAITYRTGVSVSPLNHKEHEMNNQLAYDYEYMDALSVTYEVV